MTRRLLASSLTLTLLVLVVLELPLGLRFADHERDQLQRSLERDAVVVASYVEDALQDGTTVDASFVRSYAARTGVRVVVVGDDGIAAIDTEEQSPGRSFATRPEIEVALAGRVASGTRRSETLGTDLFYVAVPVASGGEVHGAARLTFPTHEVDEEVRRYWLMLGAVAVVSLVAAALVGGVLAQSVSRPLRRLELAASAIGHGDLTRRVGATAGPPVVRSLGAAFDDMAGRLETLVGSQDAFVSDASHQLRNPLFALRLRLENLLADAPPPLAADLEGALNEVARLSRLTDGLLALARADREGAPIASEAVDVVPVVEEVRQAWLALADERGLGLDLDAPRAAAALVTPDRLRQVLDNLVANAVDVSPPGGHIALRVVPAEGVVEVHVVDEGPGLSAEDRARAFDRFWRGDDGSLRPLGGSGLGLSIAQKLATADGASIELLDGPGGGVDAVLRLVATG